MVGARAFHCSFLLSAFLPSPTNERPRARRMRTVIASGCTTSLAADAHLAAISNSQLQHRTCSVLTGLHLRHLQVTLPCGGRVASDELPPAAPARQAFRKQASPIQAQPQSVISLMTRRHAAQQASFSPGVRLLSSIVYRHVSIELSRTQRIHVHAIRPARSQLLVLAVPTSRRPAS